MALKPKLTRAATRITIEALERYAPELTGEQKQIAFETLDNLRRELAHSALNKAKQSENMDSLNRQKGY
jgi:hypothetical protein